MHLHNTRDLLLVSLLLLVPFLLNGQGVRGEHHFVSIGVKANVQVVGIANQNNYGQNEMDYRVTPGFGGGVVCAYHITPRNALLAEATFQTGGQDYDDRFKGRHFMKTVRYNMFSIPLAYRYYLTEHQEGYTGVGSGRKPYWYLLGGLQLDKIFSPEVHWYLDGEATGFEAFVLEGGNPNEALIDAQGPPASDTDLYTKWDAMFIAAGGFELDAVPMGDVHSRAARRHRTYRSERNSLAAEEQ